MSQAGHPMGQSLALVLSGGGARGAFQAGVYEVLAEDERFKRPVVLTGTSAGAINAALIAHGKTPDEIREFWLALGDEPPVTTDPALFRGAFVNLLKLALTGARIPSRAEIESFFRRAAGHLFPDPGNVAALAVELLLTRRFDLVDRFLTGLRQTALADTRLLRERLVDALGGERIETSSDRVVLAVSTVDALSHKVVRFVNRVPLVRSSEKYVVVDAITVDMVLASASIPLLFPAVRLGEADGRLFWDGGVLVNTPMAPAVALGADSVLPILSTQELDGTATDFASFGDAVEHLSDTLIENSYNVDRKLLLERNRIAQKQPGAYRKVTLWTPVRPKGDVFSAGSYLYFQREKLAEMYDFGRNAAAEWLRAGPRIDELNRGEPAPEPTAARPRSRARTVPSA